jgi:hypothetical protein
MTAGAQMMNFAARPRSSLPREIRVRSSRRGIALDGFGLRYGTGIYQKRHPDQRSTLRHLEQSGANPLRSKRQLPAAAAPVAWKNHCRLRRVLL